MSFVHKFIKIESSLKVVDKKTANQWSFLSTTPINKVINEEEKTEKTAKEVVKRRNNCSLTQ